MEVQPRKVNYRSSLYLASKFGDKSRKQFSTSSFGLVFPENKNYDLDTNTGTASAGISVYYLQT
jgi:hypothetical protein